MKEPDKPNELVVVSVLLSLLPPFLLVFTESMRSDRTGLDGKWYFCTLLGGGLLVLDLWGLRVFSLERWLARLGLYLSLGLVLLNFGLLVDYAREEAALSHWAHRGIHYGWQ